MAEGARSLGESEPSYTSVCKEPCGVCHTDVLGNCRGRVEAKGWFIYAKPIICFLFIIIFFIRTKGKIEAWGD